jgi:L-arabinonolactonase
MTTENNNNNNNKLLTIYLARHGQDEDNANGILNGRRRDRPLTETGRRQAQRLSEKIAQTKVINNISIDAVYSSPLQRALETARILLPAVSYVLRDDHDDHDDTYTNNNIGTVDVTVLEDLAEREFGVMTGVPVSKISERCGGDNNDPNNKKNDDVDVLLKTESVTYFLTPEGAETFPELMHRAQGVLEYLQKSHNIIDNDTNNTKDKKKKNISILLVTHGDFGKMFFANYYKLDWKDVLRAFHFDNSDLILCSPHVTDPLNNISQTHVFANNHSPSITTPTTTIGSPMHVIDLQALLNGPPARWNDDGVSVTAQLVVDCRCHLGECVIYDDRENAVLFTSILERKFHKLSLRNDSNNHNNNGLFQSYDLPKMLCAFGLLDKPIKDKISSSSSSLASTTGPGYIVAWEDGFQLYHLEGGMPLSRMSEGDVVNRCGLPDRLNDGRVDPTGRRFVCGGCAANGNEPLQVYRCQYNADTQSLHHRPIVDEIRTTNSICWSNDGKVMYLADSTTRRIDQYDYNLETGEVTNRQVLHYKERGDPDGSVVDAQGYVWNATWRQGRGTGMVDRIDPHTGQVVFTVHLPDETSEASCCCFGGPNLDILFITTAWEHLDPQSEPHAGGLYAVKLPSGIMSGCLEKRFIVA